MEGRAAMEPADPRLMAMPRREERPNKNHWVDVQGMIVDSNKKFVGVRLSPEQRQHRAYVQEELCRRALSGKLQPRELAAALDELDDETEFVEEEADPEEVLRLLSAGDGDEIALDALLDEAAAFGLLNRFDRVNVSNAIAEGDAEVSEAVEHWAQLIPSTSVVEILQASLERQGVDWEELDDETDDEAASEGGQEALSAFGSFQQSFVVMASHLSHNLGNYSYRPTSAVAIRGRRDRQPCIALMELMSCDFKR
jgi:hypothetical protein